MSKPNFFAWLAAGTLLAASPAMAKDDPSLARVDELYVTVSGGTSNAFRRDNVDMICKAALEHALEDEDIAVTSNRVDADAELVLTGSTLTITEGPSDEIGKVILNYIVTVRVGSRGAELFNFINAIRGDTAADTCKEMAEEVAGEVAEAIDDAD